MASFQNIWESFLGYNPDEANKNLLGEGYKNMGKNTMAADNRNSLIGSMAFQPNQGAIGPVANLAGRKLGAMGSQWMQRLMKNEVGYFAPGASGPVTPAPGVAKDLFSVGDVAQGPFNWSAAIPSGTDIASTGLATALNLTGADNGIAGKALNTAASGASAAAQGGMNPLQDADFVFKFFRTLGVI
jgi:hypothetical protein